MGKETTETGKFTAEKATATAIATKPRCHWIKTATAIFRRLNKFNPKIRLQFFNGNGNAKIYYDGTTSRFLVAYTGNSFSEATGIFDALRDLQLKRQLIVEDFESIERPVFVLQAKIF